MIERLDGKVALITGAARGQGRNHATRLAELGADIIAIDICQQIETVPYRLATLDDLAETVHEVESRGRRIVALQADVRDAAGLRRAVDTGMADLGGIDIVCANAGIAAITSQERDPGQVFRDVVEVILFGVWNTVQATAYQLIDQGRGGSIVITSSTQGLTGRGGDGSGGLDGYCAAKHGLTGLMRTWANWLAPHRIRVNTVNPTAVNTVMASNASMRQYAVDHPSMADAWSNLMPVPWIETTDVSSAVAWLVSDSARYVTGVTLPIDAGFVVR
jgi:SDR family mycofactocin-dependent oxidoreductase